MGQIYFLSKAERERRESVNARKRRQRDRQKEQIVCCHIEVSGYHMALALLQAERWVPEAEPFTKEFLEMAIAQLLNDWCERWLSGETIQ